MSAPPPPRSVVVRKAVTREASYAGVLGAVELPQFAAMLDGGKSLAFAISFGRDDEDRPVARVSLKGAVDLVCQRCLGNVTYPVDCSSTLGLVLTDEQACALPRYYEPWIVGDEIDTWAVAAEELALALPAVAYHDSGDCEAPAHSAGAPVESPGEGENPFGVLSSLLSDDDAKE